MATAPVGVFVHAGDLKIAARFNSNAMRFIKAGDPAEVALGTYPGKILEATVADVVPITGEGQLTPSGNLRTSSSFQHPGQLLVLLEFNDDFEGPPPPTGTGCAVAIYTERMKVIRIVRKVVIRIQAWFNYL